MIEVRQAGTDEYPQKLKVLLAGGAGVRKLEFARDALCVESIVGPVHKNCGRAVRNRVDRRSTARPAYKKSQTAQGLGD